MSSGGVRWIAAYAAALGVRLAFRVAGSWVSKAQAEGTLGGRCGRPHSPDLADAVEQKYAFLDEEGGVSRGC